jgi:hypothetical protein
MAKMKKAKRDNRIVTYVRLRPEEHAWIAKLVADRGYPHTFASVTAELISKSITAEVARDRRRAPEGDRR